MKRIIKAVFPVLALAAFLFLLFVVLTRAQTVEIVASGGNFILEKSSIAGGGSDKQLSNYSEHGTTGQAIAGVQSSGGSYSIYSGFWTPDQFVPTAGGVSISGRILTAEGTGIRNVALTITFPSGEIRSALSGSRGTYRFDDIPVGDTYIISVSEKRFTFEESSRVEHVVDELTDVNFMARPLF